MINNSSSLAIFETYKIRRRYDEKTETWYFSVIDIIAALTEQVDFKKAKSYWSTLKNRLKNEGSELVTKCDQLKMQSADGKFYETDAADVETILRLVQSVPSPKAEPIKLWLARVGYERMQEMVDPERALNRSRDYWQKMGRSSKWIQLFSACFESNKIPAKKGGKIARDARVALEKKIGKSIVTGKNFLPKPGNKKFLRDDAEK